MKTALIITYYWPPAGGPGVQRWLKFVRYLPEYGVRPIVYVPSNPFYPQQDESLLDELPDHLEVISRPIREPYNLASLLARHKTKTLSSGIIDNKDQSLLERLLLYVRGNLFVPDARVGWVRPSIHYLKDKLAKYQVEWVISSGPPHSLHLIGYGLQNETGVKWLADFRDPWTGIHYHDKLRMTERTRRQHQKLERRVLNAADQIVVTSRSTAAQFRELTDRPVTVITNGFDGEPRNNRQPDKFTLAHIGSLLSERNPELLWSVLCELMAGESGFREDLELQLTGNVSDEVIRTIKSYGLSDVLVLKGYVSHQLARQLQAEAAVLLLVESNRPETRAIIPGKLFEYMASGRPILAIGPNGSDVGGILNETNTGTFFCYEDKAALKSEILSMYRKFREGKLEVSSGSIAGYSRRSLTGKLAKLIT